MSDTVMNDSGLINETPGKVVIEKVKKNVGNEDDGGSDIRSCIKVKDRSKKKRRSDSRKHHSLKASSFSSRKKCSSQDHCSPKKNRRSSSENPSYSQEVNVKEEVCSDYDQNSSVSDIHRPLLLTRSRIRRIERRKAFSSNSSALESDNRKTKSEPIIITLDSDSEDNTSSLASHRPNRSARIKGELIRKLSAVNTKPLHKPSDSSSSSEYENLRTKKKSKLNSPKMSLPSSIQTSKRKTYLVSHLSCRSRLKLRKHRKPTVPIVYSSIKEKHNIRSIRKNFQDRKKRKSKLSLKKKNSTQASTNIERRTLRSTSIDIAADHIRQENLLSNIKIEKVSIAEVKPQSKVSGGHEVANDIEEAEGQVDTVLTEIKEAEIENQIVELTSSKIEVVNEMKMELPPEQNAECAIVISNKETDMTMEVEAPREVHIEQALDPNIEAELSEPVIENTEAVTIANSEMPPKEKKSKEKIKPCDKIASNGRKRGRPRLSEMKPVKNIPLLNDVIQIPFLQSSFCFVVAPKLSKCRECRIAVNRTNRSMHHAYCRFMEYRKLCYNKNGAILNAGFSEPSEATPEHLNQWLPKFDDPPKDLNFNTSKALIEHIGDQFCDLIEQEKEASSLHIGKDKIKTWKRIVQGVREMCDVCYTTLFNIHWVCPVCGLAVCIDCYKGRKQGITIEYEDGQPKNRDQYNWLLCTLRQPHDPEKLVMAQIIPGNALWTMRDLLHKARKKWNIPSYCKCNPHAVTSSDKYISTGICKQLMCSVTKSFSNERSPSLYYNGYNSNNMQQNGDGNNYDDLDFEVTGTALKWLEGDLDELESSNDYCFSYEDFSSLRGNLLNGMNGGDSNHSSGSEREATSFSLDEIIACVTQSQQHDYLDSKEYQSGRNIVKHFSSRYPQANSGRDPLPIRIYTKLESDLAFSDVPHSWFCNGRLLFLLQSDHLDNLALFQEQWKRGQPILVKGVDERLNRELWHPDAFCRDFGEVRNDLVDCRTGAIIRNLPMRRFWEGFECFGKRLKDDDGEYMLLKLKDWPPGDDFSEMLPKRFQDLMKALPLPEYTHRDGILNLAGRLPSWFVRPDLGPKMYNAYGSALYPTKGTTNLHLDVSDAVNVMVYVGIPQDGNAQLHIEEALKAIDEGGCDSLMRARIRCRGAKPGALWHIYNARDADKIREMLTRVAVERGEKLEAHHDPIHDQSWYLDAELRKRLYRDYGVEGYAIAQCLGDAVFIPAGAPHQVRNLHSCVKVAEDFVSPENIAHCFKLTQEFRHLSDTHTNHEDKLQIKNIIYHVVRDALAHLLLPNHDDVESGDS